MNDSEFSDWVEKLQSLRASRLNMLHAHLEERHGDYKTDDFKSVVQKSVEKICQEWWAIENEAWKRESHPSIPDDREKLKSEIEALIDYEYEAIQSDHESLKAQLTHWKIEDVDGLWEETKKILLQIKSTYRIKIDFLGSAEPKKAAGGSLSMEPFPTSKPVMRKSSSRQTSSAGLLGMLLLGLILGGGFSFYFYDASKKSGVSLKSELEKMKEQKTELENTVTMMKQSLIQLAEGRQRSFPQLETQKHLIRQSYRERREKLMTEFKKEKERILKKKSSGSGTQKELEKLETRQAEAIERLKDSENGELEPFEKQTAFLKELINHQ